MNSQTCTYEYFFLPFLTGSRDGAVVRALAYHQCGPGWSPGIGVRCGLSLLLVLVLASRGFSPVTPVFPSPQKPTFLNSNSMWTQWTKSHLVDVPLLIPIYFNTFSCQRFCDASCDALRKHKNILAAIIPSPTSLSLKRYKGPSQSN